MTMTIRSSMRVNALLVVARIVRLGKRTED
jgi:hypothetical protein